MPKTKAEDNLILVAFGETPLAEMMKWIDTDREEELQLAWLDAGIPVWRPMPSCEPEQVTACMQFLAYQMDLVVEMEAQDEHQHQDGESRS